MGRIKKSTKIAGVFKIISDTLPSVFWIVVLFGFEEKFLAITTIVCALVHEFGHIICILLLKNNRYNLRSTVNGFRIKASNIRSYDEEILIYLSGPLANIIFFALCVVLSLISNSNFMIIGTVNIFTALSNLLPIKGYDGYGALRATIKKHELPNKFSSALSITSSSLVFAFCILSLYLIDRYNGGYWIFGVFFVSMIKELKSELGD